MWQESLSPLPKAGVIWKQQNRGVLHCVVLRSNVSRFANLFHLDYQFYQFRTVNYKTEIQKTMECTSKKEISQDIMHLREDINEVLQLGILKRCMAFPKANKRD